MSHSNQVIAIGIDIASPELIWRWAREGHLPALASLMRRGARGNLSSVSDISSGSIWPTFFTGNNPVKNGQFFTHMQLISGAYRIGKKYADDVKTKPFWSYLSDAGKKVCIIDIPQTYPIKNLNGIQITGWGAEYPGWKRSSWPPPLINEMVSRFGPHPLANAYRLSIKPQSLSDYKVLYRNLLTGAEKKGAMSLELLKREPWDFFLTIFPETHWATHLLWHIQDKNHKDYDDQMTTTFGNPFLGLLSKIDSYIQQFVETYPDATFLIFSLSGMGPNYSGWHLLPEVLEKLGLAGNQNEKQNIENNLHKGLGFLPSRRWGSYKIRKVEDTLSLKAIETAKRIIPERIWDKGSRYFLYAGNNWSKSRAFCIPNDYSGAIRINLIGREPHGKVQPGTKYDTLCEEIKRDLLGLKNASTGENAVSEVIKIRDFYQTKDLGDFPDLIVKWKSDRPIQELTSPKIGRVTGEHPERRTGAHRPYGFIVASGKNIQPKENIEGNIMDLAPTILHLLGQSVPSDMDGKILSDMIYDKFPATANF